MFCLVFQCLWSDKPQDWLFPVCGGWILHSWYFTTQSTTVSPRTQILGQSHVPQASCRTRWPPGLERRGQCPLEGRKPRPWKSADLTTRSQGWTQWRPASLPRETLLPQPVRPLSLGLGDNSEPVQMHQNYMSPVTKSNRVSSWVFTQTYSEKKKNLQGLNTIATVHKSATCEADATARLVFICGATTQRETTLSLKGSSPGESQR